MWTRLKEALSKVKGWIIAAGVALAAFAAILFFRSRTAVKNAEAEKKADIAGAKAEVHEGQAAAKEQGTLPVLEEAEHKVDAQLAATVDETKAKLEAGKDDDAKALVEAFRRSGY